jgi:hypothetical protein
MRQEEAEQMENNTSASWCSARRAMFGRPQSIGALVSAG